MRQWQSIQQAGPAEGVDVVALTTEGNIYRARRAWNGRCWVWAYWDRDAGLPETVTHWAVLTLPEES